MTRPDWPPALCRDLLGEEDVVDVWFLLSDGDYTAPRLVLVRDGGPDEELAWVN